MKLTKIFFVLTVGTLSACGSSSSNSGGEGSAPLNIVPGPGAGGGDVSNGTVGNLIASFEDIETALEDDELAAASLPTSGLTTMNGYIGTIGDTDDDLIVGNLTVAITNATSEIAADASDFALYDVSDAANPTTVSEFGGTLTGSGLVTGTTLSSSLDGTLTSGEGDLEIVSTISGDLFDNGGDVISIGTVEGTINGDGGVIDGEYVVSE